MVSVDVEDTRTIGRRVKQIRHARSKSQAVVAGLAGISTGHLSRIESGERALDRRSLIIGLANALEVAPSELPSLPVPVPNDGGTNAAVEAVRHALMAVNHNQPGGQVVAVEALRTRVMTMLDARCRLNRQAEAAEALPDLIRDVHTTRGAGRDVAELLDLTVLLHTQGTGAWLRVVSAPLDLRSQAAALAQQAAQDRDEPTAMGIATVGSVGVLLTAGAFDLAQTALDSVSVTSRRATAAPMAMRRLAPVTKTTRRCLNRMAAGVGPWRAAA
jgi:transcriptional regulator with XRE-family HTH domain